MSCAYLQNMRCRKSPFPLRVHKHTLNFPEQVRVAVDQLGCKVRRGIAQAPGRLLDFFVLREVPSNSAGQLRRCHL